MCGKKSMKWIPLYVWKLVVWSFTRWRIHQAVVVAIAGGLFIVGKFIGISWLNTPPQITAYFVVWLVILTLVIAPACLWHELELQLTGQSRPWAIIDGYEGVYAADDETVEEYLVETLHIVNRGNSPAASIAIRPVQRLGRTARLLSPLPTLGPNESTDARILNLKYMLERVNQEVPKVMGRPWSVRIPLTVEYYDLNHVRWMTDHAISFNAMGISIDIAHPNEPQEWTDVSSTED